MTPPYSRHFSWTETKTTDAFASEHSTVVAGRELVTRDGQSGKQFQLTDR